jgi:hypothetical protein
MHDSMTFLKKPNPSQIFGIPPSFERILPEQAADDKRKASTAW